MKIVHLIGYFQPELGYKEYYIARNQAKLGHEVYVITSDKLYPFSNVSEIAKKININNDRTYPTGTTMVDGITVIRLKSFFDFHGVVCIQGVKKLLQTLQPDIVHAYEPVQGTPILAACYKNKFKYTLLSDHQQFKVPATLLGKLYYYCCARFLSSYMFRKADMILFATKASKDFAIRHLHAPPQKSKFIPLGFDKELFHYNNESRQLIRIELGITDKELLLISAGKITRSKQYEVVLQALQKLSKDSLFKFLLLGSGDQRYVLELIELAKKLDVKDRFIYREIVPKEKLHEYYSASDVGIWPVQPSITIIEGIGCSLPVLLPNRETVAHLVSSGNGVLFKKGDIDDLTHILNELSAHPHKLLHMREKAKYVATEIFDYQKIASQIVDLVKKYRK